MSQPRLSLTAHRGLARARSRVPFAPWPGLRDELVERWKPGEHISVFGPTGRGKTTAALALVEERDPVIVLVTKRRERMVRELERKGWQVVRSAGELRAATRRGFFSGYFADGRPRRLVLWSSPPGSIRVRRAKQAEDVRRALDALYAAGRWTVVLDEAFYVSKTLKLATELEILWHEGRSSGLSLVACSQRPSYLPLSAYSAPTYFLLFPSNDPADARKLSEIGGGVDARDIRGELQRLDRFEFLFVAAHEQPAVLLRSRVTSR